MQAQTLSGRLVISGTLEFRDKAGNLIKTIDMRGEIPLSPEQVVELQQQKEAQDHERRE